MEKQKEKLNQVLKEFGVMCPDFGWDSLLEAIIEVTRPELVEVESSNDNETI